jgi:CheY-like chemotaxis protein
MARAVEIPARIARPRHHPRTRRPFGFRRLKGRAGKVLAASLPFCQKLAAMEMDLKPITILLAEDDDDDLMLMLNALRKAKLPGEPMVVRNGAEAIDYLAGNGIYSDRTRYPFPFVLLLDLKMPLKTGFEVLEWWRKEPRKQHLTTIVLTGSMHRGDIERAYNLGATSYLCKPAELADLTEMVERVLHYWSLVQRPG